MPKKGKDKKLASLPTITVPVDLMPRVMAAFGGDADSYRMWLRGAVRAHVIKVEECALLEQQEADRNTLRNQQREAREAFAANVTDDLGME